MEDETPAVPGTVGALIAADPEFSILVAALGAAGLLEALEAPEADVTLFAPTNAAFRALAEALGVEAAELSDEALLEALAGALEVPAGEAGAAALLAEVLGYHVVPGALALADAVAAPSLESGIGRLLIGTEGGLIDADPDAPDAAFVEGGTDLAAGNGVVHAVDRVLLPRDLPVGEGAETLGAVLRGLSGEPGFDEDAGDFDVLLAALELTGLGAALDDPEAVLTLAAPTDGAFVALAERLGAEGVGEAGALDAIVAALAVLPAEGEGPAPTGEERLAEVLRYHLFEGALGRVGLAEAEALVSLAGTSPVPGAETLGDAAEGVADPAFLDALSDLAAANGVAHGIDGVLLPFALAEGPGEPGGEEPGGEEPGGEEPGGEEPGGEEPGGEEPGGEEPGGEEPGGEEPGGEEPGGEEPGGEEPGGEEPGGEEPGGEEPEGESVTGTEGNDVFLLAGDVAAIDGLGGRDTVGMGVAVGELTGVAAVAGGFDLSLGERVVEFRSIETFVFTDAVLVADGSEAAAGVARLYAGALDRQYDVGGATFWTGFAEEMGLGAVADAFAGSGEFRELYGEELGEEFVSALYAQTLGREADAAGLLFWTGALETGAFDAGDVLLLFTESEEGREFAADLTDGGVLLIG